MQDALRTGDSYYFRFVFYLEKFILQLIELPIFNT